MNHSKLILSLSCFVAVTLTSPLVTAAPRGGGGGHGGGGHFSGGHSFGGRPGMGAVGGRSWNGRNWGGRNWNGRNWSGGNWKGHNWHGHHGHNNVIFIGDFGFPGWAGDGAGVGAVILTGATPIMDTMIMVIRTVTTATGMVMDIPATDTTITVGTAMEIVANTRLLPGRKSLSYSADSAAPAIIADRSMES